MTDSKETTPTKTEQISFTEKEERVLKVIPSHTYTVAHWYQQLTL